MELEKLAIEGAWRVRSAVFPDERGSFREWFKSGDLTAATGRNFEVRQSNISISRKGALRGLHYSLAPEGQGKWVTCVAGSVWDVIVDIRTSSATFKSWISVELNAEHGDSVFISPGLAHGFIALEDNTAVSYLLTSEYSPELEFGINPMDPLLDIKWPMEAKFISQKDLKAPSISRLIEQNLLPGLFKG
jgi:dTDP-4-dehydrorhamnose 3,5-epimerase